MDRFELRKTKDSSFSLYDTRIGECYKSQHAARTESYEVFIQKDIEENPQLLSKISSTGARFCYKASRTSSISSRKISALFYRFFSFEKDLEDFYYFAS